MANKFRTKSFFLRALHSLAEVGESSLMENFVSPLVRGGTLIKYLTMKGSPSLSLSAKGARVVIMGKLSRTGVSAVPSGPGEKKMSIQYRYVVGGSPIIYKPMTI